jgi:nitric oxide reductase activation protein
LPDAIRVAGQILAKRFEEQRFLIVISDGCPYGYPDIDTALSEAISSLEKKGVIVVGIGLATERMKNFFRINTAIYDQKDLIKKFSKIYVVSSAITLES